MLTFNAEEELQVFDDTHPFWWRGSRVEVPHVMGVFPSKCVYRPAVRQESTHSRESADDVKPRQRVNGHHVRENIPDQDSSGGAAGGRRRSGGYIPVRPSHPSDYRDPPGPAGRRSSAPVADVSSFPWYAVMTRDEAGAALRDAADGTFMIRSNNDNYALSIAYGGSVKHIRVKKDESEGYFIADVKFFRTIPQLVEFYSSVSLVASFPGLDTTLAHAYHVNNNDHRRNSMPNGGPSGEAGARRPRDPAGVLPILSYAFAIYDFSPSAVNQIALKEGDRVAIVSKAGGDRGWWKGQIVPQGRQGSKKIGYFPMNYVREES